MVAESPDVPSREELIALNQAQAAADGVEIHRDTPVELTCRSIEFPTETFLIWLPSGQDRLHMLAPKQYAKGQAWFGWSPHSRISIGSPPHPPASTRTAVQRPLDFSSSSSAIYNFTNCLCGSPKPRETPVFAGFRTPSC